MSREDSTASVSAIGADRLVRRCMPSAFVVTTHCLSALSALSARQIARHGPTAVSAFTLRSTDVSAFRFRYTPFRSRCRATAVRSTAASAFCAGTRYPDSPAVRSLETGGEGHGRGADLIAHGRAEWTAAWSGSLARVKRTRGRAVEREARLGNGRDAGGWARRNNGAASGARCGESAALCSGQWTLRTHETGGSRMQPYRGARG